MQSLSLHFEAMSSPGMLPHRGAHPLQLSPGRGSLGTSSRTSLPVLSSLSRCIRRPQTRHQSPELVPKGGDNWLATQLPASVTAASS